MTTTRARTLLALPFAALLLAGCSSGDAPSQEELSRTLQEQAEIPPDIADCMSAGILDADLSDETLDALADAVADPDSEQDLPADDEDTIEQVITDCAGG